MEKNVLDTEYVLFEFFDGVLICEYKAGLEIDLTIAKKMVLSRLDISNGKSYPLLMDGSGLKSLNREAREYFNSEEAREGIIAAAFFSGSVFTTYIGNFFIDITVIKPKIPTKLFTDKGKALQWLEKYKKSI